MSARLRHSLLIFASLIAIAPLLWMFWASVKKPGYGSSMQVLGPAIQTLGPFAPPPGGTFLRFEVSQPGAEKVAVAGDFNDWTPVPMNRLGRGRWRLDVPAQPGKHPYKFVVDGKVWIADPRNPPPPGGDNSEILLDSGSPLALNDPQIIDRSYREGDRLVPVVHAEGASGVQLLLEGKSPKKLEPLPLAPPLQHVNHGPSGETIKGEHCYTRPHPEPLGPYRLEVQRSLGQRFAEMYTLGNYREVTQDPSFPFLQFFLNSLIVGLGAAFLTTLFCTLGGYAFATMRFPGKDLLFRLCMASMMVPGMIYMVPQYAVVTRLGWINTYAAMVVPHLANVFGLLLMTNYIKGLPKSLFEASKIDGASEWQTIRHVLLPLSQPAMATLFVLTFMGQWSNFLWQLIVNTPDSATRTLPVGLALFKGQYDLKIEAMMAAACFSVLPVSLLFFFSQKRLIAGLTAGGVKE